MAETRITVAWLAALGKFGTSLPALNPVLNRDGTWLEGKVIVHADGDDVIATLYWDGESEQWLVELGEPETAEDSAPPSPSAQTVMLSPLQTAREFVDIETGYRFKNVHDAMQAAALIKDLIRYAEHLEQGGLHG